MGFRFVGIILTMNTAQDILTAATDYNAEDMAEFAPSLAAGDCLIKVTCVESRHDRDRFRVVITRCVRDVDGHSVWCAADPEVKYLRWFDGRLSREDIARRAARYLGIADAQVPVEYVTRY